MIRLAYMLGVGGYFCVRCGRVLGIPNMFLFCVVGGRVGRRGEEGGRACASLPSLGVFVLSVSL